MRYTRAFTTAGVCAPCRSGIITGMYQTTLGTHHMRCRAKLPEHIRPFPVYLRQAGYFCTNNAKEDYQFETPPDTWDVSSKSGHWRQRADENQPFFAVFNFTGCHESGITNEEKYRSVTQSLKPFERQDPARLTTLPPYYPDTPITREDWKRYYELVTAMDAWAGRLMDQLKEDGLYEDTIIMFWSDHGVGLPRAKRWLYESGTHIPLIVRIPEKYRLTGQGQPSSVVDQLVSSIDFGPTVMNLVGLQTPAHMHGRPFLGPELPAPREFVFAARDRMDERYDIIRMVRDGRYQYIRNYEPLKTFYQYMNTAEKGATMRELRRLHAAGELTATTEPCFAATKPVEELYDTQADPHALRNLADQSEYASVMARLRNAHLAWVKRTKDLGMIAEPILAEREQQIGHRYGILRQEGGEQLAERVAAAAVNASRGESATWELVQATKDQDAAVRYWGAVGIGNLAVDTDSAQTQMFDLLQDSSAAVRLAAARALCRMGKPEPALPVLVRELTNGAQWERLQAANFLDEIDQQAAPVAESMRNALEKPHEEFFARGKYTVRVINRALNELEGTNRVVP